MRLILHLAATCAIICYWGSHAPSLAQSTSTGTVNEQTVIQLHPNAWTFDTTPAPASTLNSTQPTGDFPAPKDPHSTFTIRMRTTFTPSDEILAAITGVVTVRSRLDQSGDRQRQNYAGFSLPDGSVPVLDASLNLHSSEHPAWTNMTIGMPLALLKQRDGEHDVVLSFTGVGWNLYVDGQMLDNDFPFGYPRWGERNPWRIDRRRVKSAAIHFPALSATNDTRSVTSHSAIQYWTPPGHNNWVGDVETFFHNGRYHIFYLYDRRHHQSKFGAGAHYFEHLSTQDFRTWTEHEAATPLQEQWECIGTGVPFAFNDQLCLSYGLHTTRVYPKERTTLPAQWEYLKQHGRSGRFPRATTPGYPAGATYSISRDGIANFQKTEVMFHPSENPTVYRDPSGKLRLIANYGSKGF